MKKSLYLLFLIGAFGCEKNTPGKGLLLREIRTDNGIYQSFEYNDRVLAKENNYYGFCSTPVDEYVYLYQNGKLNKLQTTQRGIYSSLTALCNPALGIHSEEEYEYNNQGRIRKIIKQSGNTLFEYNTKGLVSKQVLYSSNGNAYDSSTFVYDSRGNMIEETNSQRGTTTYEYDNNKNPFYIMKQKPGWISAFNVSPNNVTRSSSPYGGFERKITKYRDNLPLTVEEYGVKYSYVYQ